MLSLILKLVIVISQSIFVLAFSSCNSACNYNDNNNVKLKDVLTKEYDNPVLVNIITGEVTEGLVLYDYFLSDKQREETYFKADRGDRDAAFLLFEYYTFYRGDKYAASIWVEKAANYGHATAAYVCGTMYGDGHPLYGVDLAKSEYWLAIAKERGFIPEDHKSNTQNKDEIKSEESSSPLPDASQQLESR